MQMHVQMKVATALCMRQDKAISAIFMVPRAAYPLGPAMTTRSAALAPARGVDWRWLETAVHTAWRSCRDWPCQQGGADGSWTAMPRVATHTPTPASHAIANARSFTFQTMRKWGVVDRSDDVAAVVTELLTNAIRHALPQAQQVVGTVSRWPIKVGLLHPGSHVLCAIADPSA